MATKYLQGPPQEVPEFDTEQQPDPASSVADALRVSLEDVNKGKSELIGMAGTLEGEIKRLFEENRAELKAAQAELIKPAPVTPSSVLSDLTKLIGVGLIGVNPALSIGISALGKTIGQYDPEMTKWRQDRKFGETMMQQIVDSQLKNIDAKMSAHGNKVLAASDAMKLRAGIQGSGIETVGRLGEGKESRALQRELSKAGIESGEKMQGRGIEAGKSQSAEEIRAKKEMQATAIGAEKSAAGEEFARTLQLTGRKEIHEEKIAGIEAKMRIEAEDRAAKRTREDREEDQKNALIRMKEDSNLDKEKMSARDNELLGLASEQVETETEIFVNSIEKNDDLKDWIKSGEIDKKMTEEYQKFSANITDTDVAKHITLKSFKNVIWDKLKTRGIYKEKFEFSPKNVESLPKDLKDKVNQLKDIGSEFSVNDENADNPISSLSPILFSMVGNSPDKRRKKLAELKKSGIDTQGELFNHYKTELEKAILEGTPKKKNE